MVEVVEAVLLLLQVYMAVKRLAFTELAAEVVLRVAAQLVQAVPATKAWCISCCLKTPNSWLHNRRYKI